MEGYIHRIAPSGHLIAHLSARYAYDPKRSEGIPTNRSCRLWIPSRSVPWPVRPAKRSQVRTGDPAAPPLDCKLPTGTHPADNLNVVLKERRMDPIPPRNFTHLVLGENPQLAVHCPCTSRRPDSILSAVSGECFM